MTDTTAGGHDVVVVGSLNLDHSTVVESIPRPGETVLGDDVQLFMGGKGLNQAVAAARAGAEVAMVGRVGADDAGRRLRDRLLHDGVDDRWIGTDQKVPSGMAFISVDGNSENAIVVSPGANNALTADHIGAARSIIEAARVVLVQLEVPVAAVAAAVAAAAGTVIVNPAPARTLPDEILDRADLLVPNRSELATITNSPVLTDDDAVTGLAGDLGRRLGTSVVVTLGADGAVLVNRSGAHPISAVPVQAVDTTGAGDCFCGYLAARLAMGDDTIEAVEWAMAAAAISVTRPGASGSIPTVAEVEQLRNGRH